MEMLPADKQNIVYTNRRSRETQDVLDKILKAPQEIKVDKVKEQEAAKSAPVAEKQAEALSEAQPAKAKSTNHQIAQPKRDPEAEALMKKYNSFNGKTPEFILNQGIIVNID